MASFTDKIQQFNPYIQELPVEAMVQVGMAKQAQYNQGVQKIQNYIDRVAGMEVSPKHKEYLQSKLDELGGRLKTVAAGDFSNQQLVNSVSGMAGQVSKDPIVQNGVYSAQVIKKGYNDMEAARKAGKSSPDNERFFQTKVLGEWMANPDLKTPFNGRYQQFTDYNKKLRGLAEELKKHESEINVDNPYRTNPAGQTLYYGTQTVTDPTTKKKKQVPTVSTDPTKGMPEYNMDMLRIKVKGTPAQKILDTFEDSLDANDIEQMKIDSWAKYGRADVKTFQNTIIDTYNMKKEMLDQDIVDLSVRLQDPKLTSDQVAQGKLLLAKLTKQHKDGELDVQMNKELATLNKSIETDGLDAFKFSLYKTNHLTGLAKDLSNRSYTEERLENPAYNANQKRLEFQFNQLKFKDESARGWKSLKLTEDRLVWEQLVKARELAPSSLTDVTSGNIGTGKALPTVLKLQDQVKGLSEQFSTLQSTWASRLFPGVTDETLLRKSFAKLEDDYRANPKMNLNANQAAYIKASTDLTNQLSTKVNEINYATKEGQKKAVSETAKLLKGGITTSAGTTFNQDEIADAASQMQQFINEKQSGRPVKIIKRGTKEAVSLVTGGVDILNATAFFNTYKGGKYKDLVAPFIKHDTGAVMSGTDLSNFSDFSSVMKTYKNQSSKIPEYETEVLSKIDPNSITQKGTLDPDTIKGDETNLSKFITKVSDRYASMDKSTTAFNPETIGNWWNTRTSGDPKLGGKVGWVFEKFADGTGQVVVTRGKQRQILPATTEDVMNYFPQALQTSLFNPIKNVLLTSPNGTTNLAGQIDDNPYNGVNARYSASDLIQFKGAANGDLFRYDIVNHPGNTGESATDTYLFIGYVKDPATNSWKRSELSNGYEGEGKMVSIINSLNPSNIQQAIKTWK